MRVTVHARTDFRPAERRLILRAPVWGKGGVKPLGVIAAERPRT
jgi:hypothetical protein